MIGPTFDSLTGPYNVIVADPPWQYQKTPRTYRRTGGAGGRGGAAERVYDTMTNEDIRDLPVAGVASDDAHLFLWFTNPKVDGGQHSHITPFDIAEAWGFTYRTILTWVKTSTDGTPFGGGMGWYFRGCTEHVLYATRGKAAIAPARREKNIIMARRGAHSAKPAEFMEMVERVTDGPYLELFARSRRPGWDAWGNQLDSGGVR